MNFSDRFKRFSQGREDDLSFKFDFGGKMAIYLYYQLFLEVISSIKEQVEDWEKEQGIDEIIFEETN